MDLVGEFVETFEGAEVEEIRCIGALVGVLVGVLVGWTGAFVGNLVGDTVLEDPPLETDFWQVPAENVIPFWQPANA